MTAVGGTTSDTIRQQAASFAVPATTPLPELPAVRGPTPQGYELDADLDPATRTLRGTERVTVRNDQAAPMGEVYLRVWANAPELVAHGAGATVVHVLVDGVAVAATLEGSVLRIPLPRPLRTGQSARIQLQFTATAPTDAARMGVTAGGVALWGNAVPTLAVREAGGGWRLDPFYDGGESFYTLAADWLVHLHVPAGMQDVESGAELARTRRADGSTDVVAQARGARDLLLVAGPAGQLRERDATAGDGTRVRLWSATPDAAPQGDVLRDAVGAYDHYTRQYGSSGIRELDVVDIDGVSGMEYSGAVLSRSKHEAAHEISHQWFYGAVGNDQFHDPWLDESFANFATRDYFEHGAGNRPDTRLLTWAERIGADLATPISRMFGDPTAAVRPGSDQNVYRLQVYLGGARVLEQLRAEVGSAAFERGMRAFVARFRGAVATTADYIATMSAAAGRPLDAWFAEHGVRPRVGAPASAPTA